MYCRVNYWGGLVIIMIIASSAYVVPTHCAHKLRKRSINFVLSLSLPCFSLSRGGAPRRLGQYTVLYANIHIDIWCVRFFHADPCENKTIFVSLFIVYARGLSLEMAGLRAHKNVRIKNGRHRVDQNVFLCVEKNT